MKFYVNQSIHINILKVNSMANSAILQIGTAGQIRAQSFITNSGGFTEGAQQTQNIGGFVTPTLESIPVQL